MTLRETYHVSLHGLREANVYLEQHYSEPWGTLSFWVLGRCVFFDEPSMRQCQAGAGMHEIAVSLPLGPIIAFMDEKVRAFQARATQEVGSIERSPRVMGGLPVLAGTGIPTKAIWSFHEAGYDTAGILQQYPHLHPSDIQAAIDYEASLRKNTA